MFTPDGNVVYANRTVLEMWNVSEKTQIVVKYNLIKDPVVNERLGLAEYVQRTIKGEIVLVLDVRVPLEDFSVWYEARNPSYDIESMYTDILNFPIRDKNGRLTLLVKTGTISGSTGKLTPTNTTTRAEMAQVLYNLLSKSI